MHWPRHTLQVKMIKAKAVFDDDVDCICNRSKQFDPSMGFPSPQCLYLDARVLNMRRIEHKERSVETILLSLSCL